MTNDDMITQEGGGGGGYRKDDKIPSSSLNFRFVNTLISSFDIH